MSKERAAEINFYAGLVTVFSATYALRAFILGTLTFWPLLIAGVLVTVSVSMVTAKVKKLDSFFEGGGLGVMLSILVVVVIDLVIPVGSYVLESVLAYIR